MPDTSSGGNPIQRDLALTLLIPCHLGEDWIETCLDSVLRQTISRTLFELLLVINGPRDRALELAESKLSKAPGLNYRILLLDLPSLSNARNVAIREARGRWLTWLDVDDSISPNFLEELLLAARPGVVPLAQVIDVSHEDGDQSRSAITTQILDLEPGVHEPDLLWRPLTFAACKLVESDVLATRSFDVHLRSGEDVAFFGPLFADNKLRFDNTPAHNGATYFRLVRSGSMSRQEPSFDFDVEQRLAVMKHLDDAIALKPRPLTPIMRSMMHSQALFIHRYLNRHPDRLAAVRAAVAESGLRYFPWHVVNAQTDRLAICYNFPPSSDASSVVAAKRLLEDDRQWNVVCNAMDPVRTLDPDLHMRTLSAVSRQFTVRDAPLFGSWQGVRNFCVNGMDGIREIEAEHGPQRHLYSRSMWPASHFLAAYYKLRSSHYVEWTAEFSDPLRSDVQGRQREGNVEDCEISRFFEQALIERGLHPASRSLFAWAEYLPFVCADTILFTNPHQMTFMLEGLESHELRELVKLKAVVRPHPTPPHEWYSLKPGVISSTRTAKFAYFGTFYANRGLDIIGEALSALSPEELGRVVVDIYGTLDPAARSTMAPLLASGAVREMKPLPYLDFLGVAGKYSCLIVNDVASSISGHDINPYLPSKLSDYSGTGTRIWGIVEPGSVLSRANLSFRTRIGNVGQAISVVRHVLHEEEHA